MLDQTSQQPHFGSLASGKLCMCRIAVLAKILDFIVSHSASRTISARAVCKIKSDLAPFAVVVCLIQVDSGGSF